MLLISFLHNSETIAMCLCSNLYRLYFKIDLLVMNVGGLLDAIIYIQPAFNLHHIDQDLALLLYLEQENKNTLNMQSSLIVIIMTSSYIFDHRPI
jgi:hypothetical protein